MSTEVKILFSLIILTMCIISYEVVHTLNMFDGAISALQEKYEEDQTNGQDTD